MLILTIALLSAQPMTFDDAKAPPAPADSNDDDRVKCKVEPVTGSLAGRRRICHTIAEWRKITDIGIDKAQTLVDRGSMQPSNGAPPSSDVLAGTRGH